MRHGPIFGVKTNGSIGRQVKVLRIAESLQILEGERPLRQLLSLRSAGE